MSLRRYLGSFDLRMFEYLQHQYSSFSGSPNSEARTLFSAIQYMFDGNEGEVIIEAYLLHNLAACAQISLRYDRDSQIPWDQADDVLLRTFNGFMMTIRGAIREGRVKRRGKDVYYGFFRIPDWYIEHIKSIG